MSPAFVPRNLLEEHLLQCLETGELVEFWPWRDDDGLLCGRVLAVDRDSVTIGKIDSYGFAYSEETYPLSRIHALGRHTSYLARLAALARGPVFASETTTPSESSLRERIEMLTSGRVTSVQKHGLRSCVEAYGKGGYLEVGDSFAGYCGPGSLMNKASGNLTPADLDAIFEFFAQWDSDFEIEVFPHAHADAMATLLTRGAVPDKFESAHGLALPRLFPIRPSSDCRIHIEEVDSPADRVTWARVCYAGFTNRAMDDEHDVSSDGISQLMIDSACLRRYIAYWNGQPAGAGALLIADATVGLSGLSTLPEYRGRGIQAAMIERRLKDAESAGASFATITTLPNSGSERNALRAGFRLISQRLVFRFGPSVLDRSGG